MKKILIFIVIISMLLSAEVAAETKYRISGQLTNSSTKGISGVKIELLNSSEVIKSTKTDGSGKYKLDVELLENQEYTLRLSKNNYQTKLVTFTTPTMEEKTVNLDVCLNELPEVSINGPYEGFMNEGVVFSSEGSSDPEGDILTYLWGFGDGDTSTLDNPIHVYRSPGNYEVTLMIMDQEGGEASKTTKCVITNRLPVSSVNGPYNGKVGSPILFKSEGSYDPDGGTISYEWRFGDGAVSDEPNPSHIYTKKGDYGVTLVIRDEQLAESKQNTKCVIVDNVEPISEANGPYNVKSGEQVAFDCSGSHDPDGSLIFYEWDFGDGGQSDESSPVHVYAMEGIYAVTLTVIDDSGAENVDEAKCTVLPHDPSKPIAEANGPYRGLIGTQINFDSQGSHDLDGVITSYLWDFGDGALSNMETPTHVFDEERTYIITLTVVDDDGYNSTDNAECIVLSREQTPPVIAPLNYITPLAKGNGPYSGYNLEPIMFNSSGSYDPDGFITGYTWSFGDGGKSQEPNPDHIYGISGNYTVELTVEDNQGKKGSYTTHCLIETYLLPKVFINAPTLAKEGLMIQFNSSGSKDQYGSSLTYKWTFGDGGESWSENPSHKYTEAGVFNISLTVFDGKGKEKTVFSKILVEENEAPKAELNGPIEGKTGEALIFTASSSIDEDGKIYEYIIDFGDGTFTNQANATHVYAYPGLYNVTLTVRDNCGKVNKTGLICRITEKKISVTVSEERHLTMVNEEVQFNPLIYDSDGIVTQVLWDFGDGEISTSRNPRHTYSEEGKYTATITLLGDKEKLAQTTVEVDVRGVKSVRFPVWTTLTIVIIASAYVVQRRYNVLETYSHN